MTKADAARILDPETSREALLPYAYDGPQRLAVVEEACRMGAAALRPVSRERAGKVWSGCRSCKSCRSCVYSIHDLKDMPCKKCDPNAEGIVTEYKPSNFCPTCGKPLTDEAVDILLRRLEALHGQKNP